jgi:hypothetical protein
MNDKLSKLEGALEVLTNQIVAINAGTANALQMMDAQLNQIQQVNSYRTNMANSNGMGNPSRNPGRAGRTS